MLQTLSGGCRGRQGGGGRIGPPKSSRGCTVTDSGYVEAETESALSVRNGDAGRTRTATKRIRKSGRCVGRRPPEDGKHCRGWGDWQYSPLIQKRRVGHPDSSPRVHPRFTTLSTDVRDAALRSNIRRTPIDSSDFSDERPRKLLRIVRDPARPEPSNRYAIVPPTATCMACRMNDEIPVVVRMRVECGHAEDESYEFDMPIGHAQSEPDGAWSYPGALRRSKAVAEACCRLQKSKNGPDSTEGVPPRVPEEY
jgi:hypothetical protein